MEPMIVVMSDGSNEDTQELQNLFGIVNDALKQAGQPELPQSAKAELDAVGVFLKGFIEGFNDPMQLVEADETEPEECGDSLDACEGCVFQNDCVVEDALEEAEGYLPEDDEVDCEELPEDDNCGDPDCELCYPDEDPDCELCFEECCPSDDELDEVVETKLPELTMKKRIILFLTENLGQGFTSGEIAEYLGAAPSTVRGRVSELVRSGILFRDDNGKLFF